MPSAHCLAIPQDDERLVALYTAKLLVLAKDPAQLVQKLRSSKLFIHIDQDLPLIRMYYKVMRDEIAKTPPDKLYEAVDSMVSKQNSWPALDTQLFNEGSTF